MRGHNIRFMRIYRKLSLKYPRKTVLNQSHNICLMQKYRKLSLKYPFCSFNLEQGTRNSLSTWKKKISGLVNVTTFFDFISINFIVLYIHIKDELVELSPNS